MRRKKSGGMDAERGRGRAAHSSDDERRNTRNGKGSSKRGSRRHAQEEIRDIKWLDIYMILRIRNKEPDWTGYFPGARSVVRCILIVIVFLL